MTLWRLEWLRLVRSRRLVALVGVYAFFGLLGPVTARYMSEIIERFGGGVQVIFPDPVPSDGIAQYLGNVAQIGLLVAVLVAAGALVIDAVPEMSIFLRTRVSSVRQLLVPRVAVVTAAVCGAYLVGLGLAWYETVVLLGAVPIGGMALGLLLQWLYLVFVVALVAAVGTRTSSVVGAVGWSVVVLLALPIFGIVEAIGRWLPSHLVGAQVGLLGTAGPGEFVPAAVVTCAVATGLFVIATRAGEAREL
ncbi:MAG: hypothetical protein JSV07_03280 [Acidimicrobiia bacterium]|nr:MAG: hypothetical protein JSV07_03280 [Acidimicrobiia bacterium]